MTRRREITQHILDLLPAGPDRDIEYAMRHWYRNIRTSGGFRLTDQGYDALIHAGIQGWQVEIRPGDLTRSGILALDRQMQWPYYIDVRGRRMILFGSSEAMMLTLYGDLSRYLGIPARDPGSRKS